MAKKSKSPVYIPYPREIAVEKKTKLRVVYNGGEITFDPKRVEVVMFYGATADLPMAAVDLLARSGCPAVIHRKHLPRPAWVIPGLGGDRADALSHQIRARDDGRRCRYIARRLLESKFERAAWMLHCPRPGKWTQFPIQKLRMEEARLAKVYWKQFYANLGHSEDTRRRKDNPLTAALDAVSVYQAGIILRWLIYHRLSPLHGFLHTQTTYPSLVYDLMEPYRDWVDRCVHAAATEDTSNTKSLIERSTANYKAHLAEPIYCPATRQVVARKVLLHGVVLALRAYLLGEMQRFVIPVEGERQGGRPPSISWRMPGGRAGFNLAAD